VIFDWGGRIHGCQLKRGKKTRESSRGERNATAKWADENRTSRKEVILPIAEKMKTTKHWEGNQKPTMTTGDRENWSKKEYDSRHPISRLNTLRAVYARPFSGRAVNKTV